MLRESAAQPNETSVGYGSGLQRTQSGQSQCKLQDALISSAARSTAGCWDSGTLAWLIT